jgi:hypothetical protein
MADDLLAFIEYRAGDEWHHLGTYHPGHDERMLELLGRPRGPPALTPTFIEPRGLPEPCAFETWLATQRTQGKSGQLGEGDTATIRIARMVGTDLSRLVAPAGTATWLNAADLRKLFRKHGAPNPTWKGLLALIESLPEGRVVGLFV